MNKFIKNLKEFFIKIKLFYEYFSHININDIPKNKTEYTENNYTNFVHMDEVVEIPDYQQFDNQRFTNNYKSNFSSNEDKFTIPKTKVKRILTLQEVYNCWSIEHFPTLTKSGKAGYISAWNHFPEEIRQMAFIEIKYAQYQSIIIKLHNDGLSFASQKKIKNIVSQLCKWAIKNEYGYVDYSRLLKMDKHFPIQTKIPFSPYEIKQLWLNVDKIPFIEYILILIYTGLRISEFLRLESKNDIFLNNGYFIVRKSKTLAGTNRPIPIHKDIMPFFKKHLKHKYFVTDKNGIFYRYSRFRSTYKDILKELGINHTIHETRHTFATILDDADANHLAIKKMLGHQVNDVTGAVYTHKKISSLIEAIHKLKGRDLIYMDLKETDTYIPKKLPKELLVTNEFMEIDEQNKNKKIKATGYGNSIEQINAKLAGYTESENNLIEDTNDKSIRDKLEDNTAKLLISMDNSKR